MPTFVKAGFWEKAEQGFKRWLNLDNLIEEVTAASLATKESIVNTPVPLVDGATIELSSINTTLTSSSATRTFTISQIADDMTMEVILNTTDATYTFPTNSLTVSEGVASGDNILTLSGVSGDHYIIGIKNINGTYYVVAKNFSQ